MGNDDRTADTPSRVDIEEVGMPRILADLADGGLSDDEANAVADWLLKQVPLEVPAGVAEANAGRVFNQQIVNLQRQGVPLETLQERAEELMAACRSRAAQDLKLDFIFAAIAKKENLTTTEDELQARVSLLAQNYGRPVERMYEDLEKRGYLSALRDQILTDKVYALLLGKATITEVEPKAEEPAAEEKKESNEEAEKPKTKKSPARKKAAKKDAEAADDQTT